MWNQSFYNELKLELSSKSQWCFNKWCDFDLEDSSNWCNISLHWSLYCFNVQTNTSEDFSLILRYIFFILIREDEVVSELHPASFKRLTCIKRSVEFFCWKKKDASPSQQHIFPQFTQISRPTSFTLNYFISQAALMGALHKHNLVKFVEAQSSMGFLIFGTVSWIFSLTKSNGEVDSV